MLSRGKLRSLTLTNLRLCTIRLVHFAVIPTLQEAIKEVEKKDTNTLHVPNPDDEDTDDDDVYENVQFSVPKAQPPRK